MINIKQAHRLVTHEDSKYFHLHKMFGIAVLGHFFYRLYHWGFVDDTLGFDSSIDTLKWIAVHAMLHVSSFQFVLSNRRNKVYNIIWPEMRLHSMLFAYRSLAVMTAHWCFQNDYLTNESFNYTRWAIVLVTMALADSVTYVFKNDGSTTMRGNPYPSATPAWFIKAHNLFYSVSQVYATLNMLFSNNDLVFLSLIAIQTAPFGMTLQKKGIISQAGWHVSYTAALLINYYYAFTHDDSTIPGMKLLAFAFSVYRFYFNMNKYALWCGVIWISCLQKCIL